MHEIVINLHMHTIYSDGFGTHKTIVDAGLKTGIDAVIVTDHNVWVNGPEKYYHDGERRILMLVGEEVHDRQLLPQKNHLLVFGANQEMVHHAADPQNLIDEVRRAGGLSFIAHPSDPAAPAINEVDLSWADWAVTGFTGIELWNAMTELKSLIRTKLHAVFYAFNPKLVARGPLPEVIKRWDQLLSQGEQVVAIGGSDAHAFEYSLGFIQRVIYPYEFHFRAVNTHLLLEKPLTGDLKADRLMILDALKNGHAFIGYDLPTETRGFRFVAHGKDERVSMGDRVSAHMGVTFQIKLPFKTECHLLKDGITVKTWTKSRNCTYITSEPGVYRVEAYLQYLGKRRAWIFSNPIYVIK
jgi:hypothetical protein